MISFLQVENLSKRFGEQLLFENITFGIGKNQKVALIAKNGMGKSTLLRIIAGKDSADTGSVIFRNDISIGILDQDPELNPENYVFEEVFNSENPTLKLIKTYEQAVKDNDASALEELIPQMDALAAWDYDTQVKQILSELKVDKYSQRIKELSGGQRKRVGLAKILISNPDFLILDEPTRGIDIGTKTEIQKLVLDLADQGMAVTFISSEVEEMLRTCSRMAVLRDGEKVGELNEQELSQGNIMKAIAGGDDK